jgi:predicted aspartyl protease
VGRILVQAKLENLEDLVMVTRGALASDQVRSSDLALLVDTGAKYVSLPARAIQGLGLRYLTTKPAKTAGGVVEQRIFSAVRLTLQGRFAHSDVAELPEDAPALLGQIPLELLDFWIDTTNQKLVGNPEHGGEWMIDQY